LPASLAWARAARFDRIMARVLRGQAVASFHQLAAQT